LDFNAWFITPKRQILVSQPLVDKSNKAQTQDEATALEKWTDLFGELDCLDANTIATRENNCVLRYAQRSD
jgi:hypothetical protein